ncbi:protein of unknown function [Pararobbsia alpina]
MARVRAGIVRKCEAGLKSLGAEYVCDVRMRGDMFRVSSAPTYPAPLQILTSNFDRRAAQRRGRALGRSQQLLVPKLEREEQLPMTVIRCAKVLARHFRADFESAITPAKAIGREADRGFVGEARCCQTDTCRNHTRRTPSLRWVRAILP